MDVADFDFELPDDLIAQEPAAERDGARLLALDRATGATAKASVGDLPAFLRAGDLLVVNDTRVFPARLLGNRVPSGGAVECLLVSRLDQDRWEALMHPGQKLKAGTRARFSRAGRTLECEVEERKFFGRRVVRLWSDEGVALDEAIDAIGHVPLPPYIKRDDRPEDRERYQTVFARERGSVAAPTAGLHLTARLLAATRANGCRAGGHHPARRLRHVQPVREATVEAHQVDAERFGRRPVRRILDQPRARRGSSRHRRGNDDDQDARGRRARDREGVALRRRHGAVHLSRASGSAWSDGLLTNFHLPRSSLLMLVSAFAGRERVLSAYREAVAARYRFYSYGDAMLVL